MNMNRIVRDIKWCLANNEWYEACSKDKCFSYNYECPYATLCEHGEDPRFIDRDFNVEPWEPYKQEEEASNV